MPRRNSATPCWPMSGASSLRSEIEAVARATERVHDLPTPSRAGLRGACLRGGMSMKTLMLSLVLLLGGGIAHAAEVKYYSVPKGAHPHDVAPDPKADGPVWYTAQHQ